MEQESVIIVVGRSNTAHDFAHEVDEYLYDGYSITAIHPLGEPGVDGKERFVCFVGLLNGGSEFPWDTQQSRLAHTGLWGVRFFASMEEALEYAKEEYGMGEERVRAHERAEQARENFPPITAREGEMFVVFDAMLRAGHLNIAPAKLDGERCVAIFHGISGPDEFRASPFAILVNEHIASLLELPFSGAESDS